MSLLIPIQQALPTPGSRILIFGDVMLDEYIWGRVSRISPEAPVPVVVVSHRTYVAGGAGNLAANVACLGGRAILAGVTGQDQSAAHLCEALQARDVAVDNLLVDPSRSTTTKTRVVAHHHQIARLDTEDCKSLSQEGENVFLDLAEKEMPAAGACVVSDYGKGVVTPSFAERLIGCASVGGKPIIIDPKGIDYTKYRGASIITPNTDELELAVGRRVANEEELESAVACLMKLLPGTAILVTRGAQGMSLFRACHPSLHLPTAARAVYDVTGAGDTVVSMLALALASGFGLELAANLANQAAAIVVGKMGTSTVTVQELDRSLIESARNV